MTPATDEKGPSSGEESPSDGQVSEAGVLGADGPGGADATDKSTGAAPDGAQEPVEPAADD